MQVSIVVARSRRPARQKVSVDSIPGRPCAAVQRSPPVLQTQEFSESYSMPPQLARWPSQRSPEPPRATAKPPQRAVSAASGSASSSLHHLRAQSTTRLRRRRPHLLDTQPVKACRVAVTNASERGGSEAVLPWAAFAAAKRMDAGGRDWRFRSPGACTCDCSQSSRAVGERRRLSCSRTSAA